MRKEIHQKSLNFTFLENSAHKNFKIPAKSHLL